MEKQPKILFVHNDQATFINLDLDLLRESFSVTDLYINSRWINPVKIWFAVVNHDMVFGWFSSWHTFLPILFARILSRPSCLIVGGYDLANMPEIQYGHQRGGIKRFISRLTMLMATVLITNSKYSLKEAERNAKISSERIQMIYHGIRDPFQANSNCCEKEKIVISVGNVNYSNISRKGHEIFVRSAAFLPNVKFFLIGDWKDNAVFYLKQIATSNVFFTGKVNNDMLLDYYRRASVYVQPSLHEGFGLSVAEAMLGGCVPVVSRVGSLPEVVGDSGFFLESLNAFHVAEKIKQAMDVSKDQRDLARNHIINTFPIEKRSSGLYRSVGLAIERSGLYKQALK